MICSQLNYKWRPVILPKSLDKKNKTSKEIIMEVYWNTFTSNFYMRRYRPESIRTIKLDATTIGWSCASFYINGVYTPVPWDVFVVPSTFPPLFKAGPHQGDCYRCSKPILYNQLITKEITNTGMRLRPRVQFLNKYGFCSSSSAFVHRPFTAQKCVHISCIGTDKTPTYYDIYLEYLYNKQELDFNYSISYHISKKVIKDTFKKYTGDYEKSMKYLTVIKKKTTTLYI